MITITLIAALIATNVPAVPGGAAPAPTVGTLPAEIRARSLAAGKTYTRADGTTYTIGAGVVSRDAYVILPPQQPSIRPTRVGKHVLGEPLPPIEDGRPYYRTKVWNDITGGYIEYRAYMPGNTSFFQTELVVP